MINFQAPINSLGYGVAGYNIFKEIIKIHPSAALYPISTPEFIDKHVEQGMTNRDQWKLTTDQHFPSPSVKMLYHNDVHTQS